MLGCPVKCCTDRIITNDNAHEVLYENQGGWHPKLDSKAISNLGEVITGECQIFELSAIFLQLVKQPVKQRRQLVLVQPGEVEVHHLQPAHLFLNFEF